MKRADGGANIVMKHTDIRSAGSMTSPVIDISHHNPTPDWPRIKASGVIGVIHKATEGVSYQDPNLYQRARPAMDAGLAWSTYHFFHSGNPIGQMEWYLRIVDPRLGERLCIDHEADASLQELKDAVAFLRNERPDVQITIYSGHLIKDQLGDKRDDYLRANTSLWIAHYTSASAPTWPNNTWDMWSLWQWTDNESISGISAPVDGDRWNGSDDALVRWFGPAEVPVPEPKPPQPEVKQVAIDISAPEGVQFTVRVNGEIIVG